MTGLATVRLRDIDETYGQLRLVEMVVSKATGVSELAQMARMEQRLREYMDTKWNVLKKEAVAKAGRMAEQGKNATDIDAAVKRIMSRWAGSVRGKLEEEIERFYKLSRMVAWRKLATGSDRPLTYDTPSFESVKKAKPTGAAEFFAAARPTFRTVDEKTIEALQNQQVFWIGNHYKNNVAESIKDTTREVLIESGERLRVAGDKMREKIADTLSHVRTTDGFRGSQRQYFEGLVANAATTSRNYGKMRTYRDLGIKKFEIRNPIDERTCSRCHTMNGKTFTVDQGSEMIERSLSARTPNAIKQIHPWKSDKWYNENTKVGAAGPVDAANLAAAGVILPPYHFKCRCVTDVSVEAGSYDNIFEDYLGPEPKPRNVNDKNPPKVPRRKVPAKPKAGQPPPEFPDLPDRPGKPMKAFDPGRLAANMKVANKNVDKIPRKVQVAIREDLNSIFASEGMVIRDVLHKKIGSGRFTLQDSLGKNITGVHEWDSTVRLTKKTWDNAYDFVQGSRSDDSIRGFRMLMHEAVHGTSPLSSGAYVEHGIVMEEMATELLARRLVRKYYTSITAKQTRLTGSYSPYVRSVKNAMSDAIDSTLKGDVRKSYLKWSDDILKRTDEDAKEKLLTDTSLKWRSNRSVDYQSKGKNVLLNRFSDNFELPPEVTTGMTKTEVDELNKQIRAKFVKKVKTLKPI